MKDGAGQDIEVGDFVVYPIRLGSRIILYRGPVTRISGKRIYVMASSDYFAVKERYTEMNEKVTVWRKHG